jgi:hypothetical protein
MKYCDWKTVSIVIDKQIYGKRINFNQRAVTQRAINYLKAGEE